ncbi:MAG: glycine--tRNA ligase subunit beta [Thermoanaerobaculia bacterium]
MNRLDFLLEIRTEEIPAAAQDSARLDLARRLEAALTEQGLAPAATESYATPRRLAVVARGVPERQEDKFLEVLGPPLSAAYDAEAKPTGAAEGFARKQKVSVSELVVVQSPRGATVAARRTVPGRAATEVLAEIVPKAVGDLSFPKSMRWGAGEHVFVRPIRGVVALFGGNLVALELMGVPAGSSTVGHRLLSDGELALGQAGDYLSKLRAAHVEPDREARRIAILEAARELARQVSGSIESDSDLAATLADFVEWPGVVRGAFDPQFLELPEEITTTAMRTHQKYLPVRGSNGLLPHFVAVMDNSGDRKGFIAQGNEWVLNARLADARFFLKEDAKQKLEARLPLLARLMFQDKLGDYGKKTERLARLAEAIALAVGRPDLSESVVQAAQLSKVDLTTLMVKEFTDLQGVVGGIYARREGYSENVWKAVYDQYRPVSATDDPPRGAAGSILSLADRFDTLAGLFRIGLAPTGSRDPYGLRRSAFGAVAIAVTRRWNLDWRPVVRQAIGLYPSEAGERPADEVIEELGSFFAERLKNLLERRGHPYDEISAVSNVGHWNFADAAERASALAAARRGGHFGSLILAVKRIRNIAGSGSQDSAPDAALYREDAERMLAGDFVQVRSILADLTASRRYREAMEMAASLAPSLDRFFVDVLVNCPEENLKKNRLALLASIQREFSRLADFSEIVVEK